MKSHTEFESHTHNTITNYTMSVKHLLTLVHLRNCGIGGFDMHTAIASLILYACINQNPVPVISINTLNWLLNYYTL